MNAAELANHVFSFLDPQWCWFVVISMLHTIWQATILAALIGVFSKVNFPKSPHQRFKFQFGALLLMGALPGLNYLWLVNTEPAPLPVQFAQQRFFDGELQLFPVEQLSSNSSDAINVNDNNADITGAAYAPRSDLASLSSVESEAANPMPWWVVLTVLGTISYGLGTVAMFLRLGWAVWARSRLRRWQSSALKAMVVPEILQVRCQRAASSLGRRLNVPLLLFSGAGVAMVVGILRPVILVNTSLLSGLTPRQLEQILAHELAHIIRWDPLTLFLQRVVESLLFFHPAVWYLSGQVSTSREICCDDWVARAYHSVDYAETLMQCLQLRCDGTPDVTVANSMTLAAMGTRQSQFALRIRTLLNFETRPVTWKRNPAKGTWIAIAIATLTCCLVLVGWQWSLTPNASVAISGSHQAVQVDEQDWKWRLPELGSVQRKDLLFNGYDLELLQEVPEDIELQVMAEREACRFGQWQFGDLNSRRVAVLAEYEGEMIVRVYVDTNRNRIIEEVEQVREKLGIGNSWIVDLDTEVNEDNQVIHAARRIAITQKRKRTFVKISTLGFAEGRVRVGEQSFAARRLDVNGNGIATDRFDKLWLDFDGDRVFSPLGERMNLPSSLDYQSHRYLVHSDRIGHQLSLVKSDAQGDLQFVYQPKGAAVQIESLEGSLCDESGMVVAIRLNEDPIQIPVGKYCIANLVVRVRDSENKVWKMSLSRGFDMGWFEIQKDQLHRVELLKTLRLNASATRDAGVLPGSEVTLQAHFYTPNGLVVTNLQREKQTNERLRNLGLVQFELNSLQSPSSKPQSCGSGFV